MRIRITETQSEEFEEFEIPLNALEFFSALIARLNKLPKSRKSEFGFYGPSLDIRVMPEIEPELVNPDKLRVTRVLEMDKGKVIREREIPEAEK